MIEFTPAELSDASVLAALHARCFEDRWNEMAFRQLIKARGVQAILADANSGDPIGFILVRVAADECEILSLGVAPERRCHGLGSQLVQQAAHGAYRCGARAMFLEVNVNNTAAKQLYQELGFKEVGRRIGYYQSCDSLADALILRRSLPIPAWESSDNSSSVATERT
ncbi:MAG TPA: GNAT family N-acetyltransferase [Rhizomicrobium sp.]|nr:GNAT family N-acetyltransferase [Rhizomicrobium sp.]